MPRVAKSTERVLADQSLVVDNGGYSMKAGFATPHPNLEDCHVIPNCLARDRGKRVWVGSQLDMCNDFGEIAFRRPIEKGFIVNWEAEKAIWDSTFIDKNARLPVSLPRTITVCEVLTYSSAIHMRLICYLRRPQIHRPRSKGIATKLSLKNTNSHRTVGT